MVPLSLRPVICKVPQLLRLGGAGLLLGVQEVHSFTWSRLLAVAEPRVLLRGS